MKIGIICIGDELLRGSTVNTNLAFMGQTLLKEGMTPEFSVEVPDSKKEIIEALELALERVDVIITSGGLGPTADDVTKEFIAQRLGLPLVQDGEVAVAIAKHWKTLHHGEMPPRVMNQSLVPDGAEVLTNRFGTAPGLLIETNPGDEFPDKTIIMLPGPPSEFSPIFSGSVIRYLRKKKDKSLHLKMFRVCGIGESFVEERMLSVISNTHPLNVAYCASPECVKLFLSSTNEESLGRAARQVRDIFSKELLSDKSETLAEEVLALLQDNGDTLATAESCTGGLVSKLVTDIPGSSEVFKGGIVAYSNEIKVKLLGVSETTLEKHGAVSAECALEMVNGVAERLGTTAAIATTGIAGPDGGTPEKPVGMVYIAVKYGDRTEVRELHLRRSREQIRDRAAAKALNLLRLMVRDFPTEG